LKVGFSVAVVMRDGLDVVAGIAVQLSTLPSSSLSSSLTITLFFAISTAITLFVLVSDCNAKLAFLIALFSESKDMSAQILLLFGSSFVPFLLEKVELEVSEFLFWHEGSPC
jgi:hypothetical protein